MESYYEKCVSCVYTDLNDKSYGKFYCTEKKHYFTVTEDAKGCSLYMCGHSDEEIEKARERIG